MNAGELSWLPLDGAIGRHRNASAAANVVGNRTLRHFTETPYNT